MRTLIVFALVWPIVIIVRNFVEPYFLKPGEITNMKVEFSMMITAVLWLVAGTAWIAS